MLDTKEVVNSPPLDVLQSVKCLNAALMICVWASKGTRVAIMKSLIWTRSGSECQCELSDVFVISDWNWMKKGWILMQFLLEFSTMKLMNEGVSIVFIFNSCVILDSMIGSRTIHLENAIKTQLSPPRTSWTLLSDFRFIKCFIIISLVQWRRKELV